MPGSMAVGVDVHPACADLGKDVKATPKLSYRGCAHCRVYPAGFGLRQAQSRPYNVRELVIPLGVYPLKNLKQSGEQRGIVPKTLKEASPVEFRSNTVEDIQRVRPVAAIPLHDIELGPQCLFRTYQGKCKPIYGRWRPV